MMYLYFVLKSDTATMYRYTNQIPLPDTIVETDFNRSNSFRNFYQKTVKHYKAQEQEDADPFFGQFLVKLS